MILVADTLSERECLRLLAELVIPRPIAWITTVSTDGSANLAPFSSFAAVSASPPLVSISIGRDGCRPKDTLVNIRETGAFCVNLAAAPLLEAVRATAAPHPPEVDELELAGLRCEPARLVAAPCLLDSPAILECRRFREIDLGPTAPVLMIGEVVAFRLRRVPVASDLAAPAVSVVGHVGIESFVVVDASTVVHPEPGDLRE